jgi:shikimate kinase
MKRNVVLIGFMGVGKGTTARAFSKRFNRYSIDTDDLIESLENRSIKKIFERDGEEYFRYLEQKTANWIEKCVDNTLISCGGGFYKVKNIKTLGKVVLLDARFEWIYNRLKSATNGERKLAKRPLFSRPKDAQKLYRERRKDYLSIADTIIDVENSSLDEVLNRLYTIL